MMTGRDELDKVAGEYALGLLSADEARAFEDALTKDEAAREALRAMRERFFELDAAAPVLDASPALWERIESRLDEKAHAAEAGKVTPFRARESHRLGFWQGFASAAAAAVLLALIGLQTMGLWFSPTAPTFVVVLLDARSEPGAIVEAYGDRRVRVVPLEAFDIPQGRVLQVWTLPSPETGPVSLGLLDGTSATNFEIKTLPPTQPNQLYEITIEQTGGSPTGKPTGPIVAKGFAKAPQI